MALTTLTTEKQKPPHGGVLVGLYYNSFVFVKKTTEF